VEKRGGFKVASILEVENISLQFGGVKALAPVIYVDEEIVRISLFQVRLTLVPRQDDTQR